MLFASHLPVALTLLSPLLSMFPSQERLFLSGTVIPLINTVLRAFEATELTVNPLDGLVPVPTWTLLDLLDGECVIPTLALSSTCSAFSDGCIPGLFELVPRSSRSSYPGLLSSIRLAASTILDLSLECLDNHSAEIAEIALGMAVLVILWLRKRVQRLETSTRAVEVSLRQQQRLNGNLRRHQSRRQLQLTQTSTRARQARSGAIGQWQSNVQRTDEWRKRHEPATIASDDDLRRENQFHRLASSSYRYMISRQNDHVQELQRQVSAGSTFATELQDRNAQMEAELVRLHRSEAQLREEVEREQIASGSFKLRLAAEALERERVEERETSMEQEVAKLKADNDLLRASLNELEDSKDMSDWSQTLLAESEERHFETLEQVLELSKQVDADQEVAQHEQMAATIKTLEAQVERLAATRTSVLHTDQIVDQGREAPNSPSTAGIDCSSGPQQSDREMELVTDRLRALQELLAALSTSRRNSTGNHIPTDAEESDADKPEERPTTTADAQTQTTSDTDERIEELRELLIALQMDFDIQLDLLLEDKVELESRLESREAEMRELERKVEMESET